jgi:Ca-activated chloride channel family protein
MWWLWLAPAFGLALLVYGALRRRALKRALGDPELVELLMSSLSPERRALKHTLTFVALCLLTFAAFRPQFGRRSEVQQQSGIDVAVAFDISKSMLARDVQPSRLDAARSLLTSLITQLSGHRLALIPFAGVAFTQSPLTADKSAFRLYLRGLDPQQMPVGGTNLAMAIREGLSRLNSTGDRGDKASRSRAILLITDGEDLSPEAGEGVKEAAREAAEAGVQLYAVAVGTRSGEPIPILNKDGTHAGYQRDRSGKPIYSKLNMTLLEEAARLADPEHPKMRKVFAFDGTRDVSLELSEAFNKLQRSRLESAVRHRYGERYAYPLGLALALLLLELLLSDRRRSSHALTLQATQQEEKA